MPHVSKDKMDTKLYDKLFSQLIELPVGLSKKQSESLFDSLLTKTEQIMLTKRCAAAIMFAEGHSRYRIARTLKVSSSTAQRLQQQYEEGVFDGIVSIIQGRRITEKQREEFMATIDKLLRLGMPSMGKDRWQSVF